MTIKRKMAIKELCAGTLHIQGYVGLHLTTLKIKKNKNNTNIYYGTKRGNDNKF
jgi:hypothetical protein